MLPEPVGVVAQVTPWNHPLLMAVWKLGPAPAAGNTVVLEPAETAPGSTLVLARLIDGVLPADVVDVVPGDASTGALVSGHRTPAAVVADADLPAHATVVTGVHQDGAPVQEETVGPVRTVQPFATEDEAVEPANDVDCAPASNVWATDSGRAMRVSRDLERGSGWVSTHLLLVPEMPRGGSRRSGHGKDLSRCSVEECARVQHVVLSLGT